jgi:hypothetical protein
MPMPDKTQDPMNLFPPVAPISAPASPQADVVNDEERLAKQELKRVSPSNEDLRKFAAKCRPLPKWLDEEEPPPF